MFFLAIALRFESTSIRVEHEPVGTGERPLTGPAVARCLLQHAMVHSARSYTRRNASFSALKLPSDPAPEVAYSQQILQATQARETRMQRFSYLGGPAHPRTPECGALDCSSGRMARRRRTTVPGPDPVLPAA